MPVKEFDPKAFLAKVGDGKTIARFSQGQTIYRQGQPANELFYLQSGRVKVTVMSESRKEATIGILEPTQFFGEGCLNGHFVRLSTTTAIADSIITSITKEAVSDLLDSQPKFAHLFVAYLVRRNSRVEADLMDQLFNSSEKRLARLLLLLAHFGTEGATQTIRPEINQTMLAEMIGTTRPRVSHFMNKFRKLGLIKYDGGIEVNAALLTAVLHEAKMIDDEVEI